MNFIESKNHRERVDGLNALMTDLVDEREAQLVADERELAELAARLEARRAARDAESIAKLEAAEQIANRCHAQCEAGIVAELVPPVRAKFAALIGSPSPGAAQAAVDRWRELAERCRLELGDEPHHAVWLVGLAGDLAPRLGNRAAFDLFHHDRAGKWQIEDLGPVQSMAKLLTFAGELEARLANLSPDEARFSELTQYVARRSVERCVGLGPEFSWSGEDRIFDGRKHRRVAPGQTPAEVLATSSIADVFRKPPAPNHAALASQPRQPRQPAGATNDMAAALSVGKAYLR